MDRNVVVALMLVAYSISAESRVCYWVQRYEAGKFKMVLDEADESMCTSYQMGGVILPEGHREEPPPLKWFKPTTRASAEHETHTEKTDEHYSKLQTESSVGPFPTAASQDERSVDLHTTSNSPPELSTESGITSNSRSEQASGVHSMSDTSNVITTGEHTTPTAPIEPATGVHDIPDATAETATGAQNMSDATIKTTTGVHNMTDATTEKATGVHNMSDATIETATGSHNMSDTTIETATGVHDMSDATAKTTTGVHTMSVATTEPANGVEDMSDVTTETAIGVHNMSVATTEPATGVHNMSDVTITTTTGVHYMSDATITTTTGVHNMSDATIEKATGVHNMYVATTEPATGVHNMSDATIEEATGVHDMSDATTEPATGVHNMPAVTTGPATGAHNMSDAITEPATGVHNMYNAAIKTTTGVHNMSDATIETTTGVHNMSDVTIKTTTGVPNMSDVSIEKATEVHTATLKTPTETVTAVDTRPGTVIGGATTSANPRTPGGGDCSRWPCNHGDVCDPTIEPRCPCPTGNTVCGMSTENIDPLSLSCPPTMVPGLCHCQGTCADPTMSRDCDEACSTTIGCTCSNGYLVRGDECISAKECPCHWSDEDILIPNNEYRVNGNCTRVTCQSQILTTDYLCSLVNAQGRCDCDGEIYEVGQQYPLYNDCSDAYSHGKTQDGVYLIQPTGWPAAPFHVYCNMSIDGGGWTVFQRRVNNETDFYRNWTDYRDGFGSLNSSFWLGNEKLHHLTKQRNYTLRIDVATDHAGHFEEYSFFNINDESGNYRLHVGEVTSPMTDTERPGLFRANGSEFSTYDRNNAPCQLYNCSQGHRGAWWYAYCYNSTSPSGCRDFRLADGPESRCTRGNLNGLYNGGDGQNIFWSSRGQYRECNLRFTEMKIRPAVSSVEESGSSYISTNRPFTN